MKRQINETTNPLRWIDVLYYTRYGNPEPYTSVNKTEEEWSALLSPAQYRVMRLKETEPAFRNTYCRSFEPGIYVCRACGNPLFDAKEKTTQLAGWPGFLQPIAKAAMKYAVDTSHQMRRIEVMCNTCEGHLGHVFPDGPEPSGLRYCINSESLNLLGKGNDLPFGLVLSG